jgi:K+-transporting ATPase KdpF subunit
LSLNAASRSSLGAQAAHKDARSLESSLWTPYAQRVSFDAALIAVAELHHDTCPAIPSAESDHGRPRVHLDLPGVLRLDHRLGQAVRQAHAAAARREAMTWIYVLGGIVALALLVYLLCALLKPEWFQ